MLVELLTKLLIRPRKKGMRLDVKQKRSAAPYPRNPYKRQEVPHSEYVLRNLLGYA